MFVELMPLLRKRRLLLTISLVEGDTIRTTVVVQKASDTEDNALNTPLAITGTAEELDRELPQQLVEVTGAHLQLQSTLTTAKAELDAAAKAARDEARKKPLKPPSATSATTSLSPPAQPTPPEPEPPPLFAPQAQPKPTATQEEEEGNCNIMKIDIVAREFVYHGTTFGDPNPKLSIEEVRSFYANQFPELTTATITGPETVGDRLRYSFERAIGSKG